MELDSLWQEQLDFTHQVLKRTRGITLSDISLDESISLTKEYVLFLHQELSEVLDSLSWKDHRQDTLGLFYRSNVLEEFIDLQKFLWGMMQIWGVSQDEFITGYQEKSYVVRQREQLEQNTLSDKIVVVDLDGVLFAHDESFQEWLSTNRPQLIQSRKIDNALAWEQARMDYRLSRDKQEGKPILENIQALQRFKDQGWSIIIMTYRPKRVVKSLEYDTLLWLEQHEVPKDKVIWAAYEKYFYMRPEIINADIFIDDEWETCQMVSSLGKRVYNIMAPDIGIAPSNGEVGKVTLVDNIDTICNLEGIGVWHDNV